MFGTMKPYNPGASSVLHAGALLALLSAMCPNPVVQLLTAAVVLGAGLYAAWSIFGGSHIFGGPPRTLGGDGYVPLTLVQREEISHDTRRLRFALPSPAHILGLPAGQHVSVRSTGDKGAGEKVVSRPYTPVSGDDLVGFVDFVIKIYLPNVHPKFPAGGAMSARFERLQVGEALDFRGPKGHITYEGGGSFCVGKGYKAPHVGATRATEPRRVSAKHVGMVCGGSGVTPMLQVAEWAKLHDGGGGGGPSWALLAANQTPADVLCREQIEALEAGWPGFQKWYTVDRLQGTEPGARDEAAAAGTDVGGAPWAYGVGFVTEEMLRARLPPAGPDTVILLCGPPPMIEFACMPALTALGHKAENILAF